MATTDTRRYYDLERGQQRSAPAAAPAPVLFFGDHSHGPAGEFGPAEHRHGLDGNVETVGTGLVWPAHTHELITPEAIREALRDRALIAAHRDGAHEPGDHAPECRLCRAAVSCATTIEAMLAGAARDNTRGNPYRPIAARFHTDAAELGDRVATGLLIDGLGLPRGGTL